VNRRAITFAVIVHAVVGVTGASMYTVGTNVQSNLFDMNGGGFLSHSADGHSATGSVSAAAGLIHGTNSVAQGTASAALLPRGRTVRSWSMTL